MQPQAISMTMIAYATFDRHDAALTQAVSAKVLQVPNAFDPQAIANILWALALLDDLSPPVWNCLLVSFVQAERFNSKPQFFALMSIHVPGQHCMPILQVDSHAECIKSISNAHTASILSFVQNAHCTITTHLLHIF